MTGRQKAHVTEAALAAAAILILGGIAAAVDHVYRRASRRTAA